MDSKFSQDNADAICAHLWEGGFVGTIATKLGVCRQTVYEWAAAHPEFGKAFAAAMIGGAHAHVEEILPIVDNVDEDAQSRKVRAWGRMEIAKRKAPLIYGDKLALGGDKDQPLTIIIRDV